MPKEELEALTVEELKAKCKELGLEGYSNLKKDDLISLILGDDGKKPKEELEDDEKEIFILNASRCCKTETKGEVLGKFEISESDYKKDTKIQRFIEIGFIEEVKG
ncbi:Rho termination factor N-terminal domain-containing protein [Aliarcobacter butzleri]|uniref:Rho termination factor N-terminal domain-containing protein n=1 Tax=Aliarcobacter butzleri TaxID=28197 RepID=UPI0021B21255|nr:Rho termination factor N-terminal domain-containing protein [Aliarcobacter butzleri]MCT7551981.1 Rho termination factor N-terminal domain-containing protein [Aliarcobacter butzleri]